MVADALRIDPRWLDGVVAQNDIVGVHRGRQGVSRAFSPAAVLTIAVATELMGALRLSVASSLSLARAILLEDGEHTPAEGITLRVDVSAIERRMSARLTESVESRPPPRRGRPPVHR